MAAAALLDLALSRRGECRCSPKGECKVPGFKVQGFPKGECKARGSRLRIFLSLCRG